MSHGACPAAGHAARTRITRLKDTQSRKKLPLEKPDAPTVMCQSHQRLNDRNVATNRSVGAFDPPDRRNHLFLNTEAGFDTLQ